MGSKNEVIIHKFIKFAPVFFILLLSSIISITLYFNDKKAFDEEKNLIRNDFINSKKQLVKNQVKQVYNYILNEQNQTEAKLKESLKKRTYEAYNIAMNIYKENKHLGKKKVTKMIKDALRSIRFNNERGYFFIYSFDYKCILLPVAKHLEGTNFYNYTDAKGTYLTREIIKQVKKEKEGFLTWWYHKPNDMKNQYKKLGFNKYFEPYGWFIGTGEYIDDFENDIKKRALKYIHELVYKKNEYIFVLDYNGKYLNHIKENLIGLNAIKEGDLKDSKSVIENIIKIAKTKGNGYISYIQNRKPGSYVMMKKTSYIQGIKNWQWFIGKGFYEDDINNAVDKQKQLIEKRFKNNISKLFLITIILTLILMFLSFYISKILEKSFKKYQQDIKTYLDKITKQHDILAHQTKMAALGNMIGNIAHQWRQPLSIISTAATGMKLKKEMGNLSDEDFYHDVDYINKSTQYLSKTIDDFRNFFNTNKEKEYFSIKEAFEDGLSIVGTQFKNKEIKLIENIENSTLYGIKSEFVQVLINILNNSRDELLKVKDYERIIFINSYEKNDKVIIKIKDNAGGVSEEVIEHVFEPYFTTKHQSQGTGIGLYMSQEIIVKHMNGQITIENCIYEYKDKKVVGALTTITIPLITKSGQLSN